MRKLIVLSAISVFVIAAAFLYSCNNNKDAEANSAEDSLKAVVEHGRYLANNVAACIHCHSTRDFNKYSGPVIPGTEGGGGQAFSNKELDVIPGVFYAKNITPDPETGLGSWTDDEILRAMTKGISKNGDTLFPLMPYASFNMMAKEDLLSIVAYLKTLKPIKNAVPARQSMIPMSMAYPVEAVQASIDGNVRPPKTDVVKYGGYLVTVADCAGCHTPFEKGQPDFARMFGGGNTFHFDQFVVTSANISPDSATGIRSWTEEMFVSKFKMYRDHKSYDYDPGKLNTVMPTSDFAGMTDEDLKAIYAYLRTVPPISHKVAKYPE
ncbi:MAG TPA: cytochrome c [Chitinophagaceae bacterium]|nr:cytochrome c [Chitinophagaceae bacterium]MCB9055115.1 cytochrome c [Chitinophagales bacterium]HPG10093.1 cytochrome c [Chitinophagaceae bacterium]HRX94390.1 cytochrome c [Chitinophagaceae bacterium]